MKVHDGDQRRTGAVDWEPRAGQKAAVDETVKLKVLQCDLDAPAKESIGKKQQYQVYQAVSRHSPKLL